MVRAEKNLFFLWSKHGILSLPNHMASLTKTSCQNKSFPHMQKCASYEQQFLMEDAVMRLRGHKAEWMYCS